MNDENIIRLLGAVLFGCGLALILFRNPIGKSSEDKLNKSNLPRSAKQIMMKMNSPKSLLLLGSALSIWGLCVALLMAGILNN